MPGSWPGPCGSTRRTSRPRPSWSETTTASTGRLWRWPSTSRNWPAGDLGDLDWDAQAGFAELGRINDVAYGYPAETGMANGLLASTFDPSIRLYRARAEGEVACVLGTLDVDDDAGILFVATLPEMRGRRLASRLLTAALIEARERGMKTSSLQASELGKSIYERLGYKTCFSFHTMERRSRPQG